MKWNNLSMKDKAAIMKVAIKNGIYDLETIKNKFDEGGDIYTVKAGDTLSKIAKQLTGNINDYKMLADYNNISNPNMIRVGQQIKLPKTSFEENVEIPKPINSLDTVEERSSIIKKDSNLILPKYDNQGNKTGYSYNEPIIQELTEEELDTIKVLSSLDKNLTDSKKIKDDINKSINYNKKENTESVIFKKPEIKEPKIEEPKKLNKVQDITKEGSKKVFKKDNNKQEYKENKEDTQIPTLTTPKSPFKDKLKEIPTETQYSKQRQIGDMYFDTYLKHNIFDYSPIKVENKYIKGSSSKYHCNPSKFGTVKTPECASFLTINSISPDGGKTLNYDYINKYNYRGNAWTWQMNAKEAGITPTLNIYTDSGNFTGKESKQEVIQKTRQIAGTKEYKEFLTNNLQPGSVVNLLYPNSNKFDVAKKESKGTMLSTHIGDVIERDGKLYIRDNIHGHIKERPLENVLNNKERDGVLITGVTNYPMEERYADLSEFGYTYSSRLTRRDRISSTGTYRLIASVLKNKDALLKDGISEDEFEQYMDLLPALAYKESGGGTNPKYLHTALDFTYRKAADEISYNNNWVSKFESKGMTNIKMLGDRGDGQQLFTREELNKYGLTKENYLNPEIVETPEVSGVMTMVALHKKANELKEILKDLPPSVRENKKIFEDLLITSWNQGTNMIRKNVEKYKKNGDINELTQYSNIKYTREYNEYRTYTTYKETKDVADKLYWGRLYLYDLNKNQIKALQRDLYKENLIGKNDIDGILGNKTKYALSRYIKQREQEIIEKDKQYLEEKRLKREEQIDKWEDIYSSIPSFMDYTLNNE